jgi:hypothetical protein
MLVAVIVQLQEDRSRFSIRVARDGGLALALAFALLTAAGSATLAVPGWWTGAHPRIAPSSSAAPAPTTATPAERR